MEVTQENKNEGEIVARGTEENPAQQVPRIPTWDELPEWAKRLQVGELIPFKGSFFKLIGMTPDFAVVLKYEGTYRDWETDRKSTRLNSSHSAKSRMPSSA